MSTEICHATAAYPAKLGDSSSLDPETPMIQRWTDFGGSEELHTADSFGCAATNLDFVRCTLQALDKGPTRTQTGARASMETEGGTKPVEKEIEVKF
eukprot:3060379-Rhodomonas_salina.2